MLGEKLRSFFRREGGPEAGSAPFNRSSLSHSPLRKPVQPVPPSTRQSRGLEQFFFNIRDVVGLQVLDCGGASQDNINFLINLGHKVYTQDLVRNMDEAFGEGLAEQANASRIQYFLAQNFEYPSYSFDGVLLWDSLQYMSPALLNATVDRLYEVMRPNSYLLAFFAATERVIEVPSYAFRILDHKTIQLTDRGQRSTGQVSNNRSLEKLFSKFDSVKFFLTRDNLREVIVRR